MLSRQLKASRADQSTRLCELHMAKTVAPTLRVPPEEQVAAEARSTTMVAQALLGR